MHGQQLNHSVKVHGSYHQILNDTCLSGFVKMTRFFKKAISIFWSNSNEIKYANAGIKVMLVLCFSFIIRHFMSSFQNSV